MERRPSRVGGPFGWGASCLTTLLAASILSSCFLMAEGQRTSIEVQIQLQPPHPAEGQDVKITLTTTPGDAMEKAVVCRWYRGLITDINKLIYTYYISTNTGRPGDTFTGRETVGPGCSLHIKSLTPGDSGNYTVNLDGPDIVGQAVGQASMVVSEGQSTGIQVLLQPPHPAEGQDVILTLTTTPGDTMKKAVVCSWYRGLITDRNKLIYTYYISTNTGRPGVASTGRETVGPGCYLHIKSLTPGDSGNYTVYLFGPAIDAVGQASMVVSGSR